MIISTTTCALDNRLGYKATISLLKDAGFSHYDLSLYSNTNETKAFLDKDNYLKAALKFKSYADKIAVSCST